MTLSPRVGLLILAISFASTPSAQAEQAPRRAAAIDYDYVDALERRIEKLLPRLMGSLTAARREREPSMVRCFDQALAELHSVGRQVAYHADRLEEPELAVRARHQKALSLLSQRVDDLGHSAIRCFTEGAVSQPGETRVEVTYTGS